METKKAIMKNPDVKSGHVWFEHKPGYWLRGYLSTQECGPRVIRSMLPTLTYAESVRFVPCDKHGWIRLDQAKLFNGYNVLGIDCDGGVFNGLYDWCHDHVCVDFGDGVEVKAVMPAPDVAHLEGVNHE